MIPFFFYLSFVINVNSLHVGQVAEYYYTLKGKELQMKFVIDREELLQFDFKDGCDFNKATAMCVFNYVNSNSCIEINEKKVSFELESSYVKNGHLIVYFEAHLNSSEIKRIRIKNNCFYKFDVNYKNRIILDVGKFNKSYLFTQSKHFINLK